MKRIFALMIVLAAGTAVFAQSRTDRDRSRDVVLGQGNGNNGYGYGNNGYGTNNGGWGNTHANDGYFSERERDLAIQRINRDYETRVRWINSDRRMSNRDRKRAIRDLDNQRKADIRNINERFYRQNSRSNRYPSRY